MNLAEVEKKLDDYLMKGIVSEIMWADEAKILAAKIGDHAVTINPTEYGHLIGRLQTMASDQQTLAVARMFDADTRTRSIPNILTLIDDHITIWQLKDRCPLEDFLMKEGCNNTLVKSASDTDLILFTTSHFRQTLPHPNKASHCNLSAALQAVAESRNKVHAHNEAIDVAARTRPTWGGTESLVGYAKDFVCVISMAFLGLSLGQSSANYYMSYDAGRTAYLFERLLKAANLI